MLALLLCSSLGVCSWPKLHRGYWAGSITARLEWYSLHLLWMNAIHPKSCTWINLPEYQRPFENGGVNIVELKENHVRGVYLRCTLGQVCACMRLNGPHSASLLCLHLPGAIPIAGLSLGPNPKLIGEVKKGSNTKL